MNADRDPGLSRELANLLGELTVVPRDQIPAALGALAEADAQLRLRLGESPAPSATRDDRLLTVEDVATRLSVTEDYTYRHADQWPFTRRVGRHLRFSARALNEWLAKSP